MVKAHKEPKTPNTGAKLGSSRTIASAEVQGAYGTCHQPKGVCVCRNLELVINLRSQGNARNLVTGLKMTYGKNLWKKPSAVALRVLLVHCVSFE